MSTMVASPPLLTAEEYLRSPDEGAPTELVLGRKVEMNRPYTDHGYRMSEIAAILRDHVKLHNLGRIVCGNAGVVTRRNPDTVRGPDIAFYSDQRVPPGPTPDGYWPVPDLAVEIRSPTDRWQEISLKVDEYLAACTLCVVVIDPTGHQVHVHTPDEPVSDLNTTDTLHLTTGLPGFTVSVQKLFE